MRQPSSPDHVERIATQVVDAAIHVHRQLGPGLLESVYQRCLFHTLTKRGLRVRCEVYLPIRFEELLIENALRIDMLVEDCVLIENKSVAKLDDVHTAQLLTYLRLSGNSLGFLLNWNVPMMKDGLKRVVVNHREPPGGREQ